MGGFVKVSNTTDALLTKKPGFLALLRTAEDFRKKHRFLATRA